MRSDVSETIHHDGQDRIGPYDIGRYLYSREMKHTVTLTFEFDGTEPLTEREKDLLISHVFDNLSSLILDEDGEPILFINQMTIEHNED